jgi:hypothetical protein
MGLKSKHKKSRTTLTHILHGRISKPSPIKKRNRKATELNSKKIIPSGKS